MGLQQLFVEAFLLFYSGSFFHDLFGCRWFVFHGLYDCLLARLFVSVCSGVRFSFLWPVGVYFVYSVLLCSLVGFDVSLGCLRLGTPPVCRSFFCFYLPAASIFFFLVFIFMVVGS